MRILFVDDGSTDRTGSILESMAHEHSGKVDLLTLDANVGKAEAVRKGLVQAAAREVDIVGYIDADLATPVSDVLVLFRQVRERPCQAVIGSRVALSGRQIDRAWMRHYLGRIFSTAGSFILNATIYDTQCGAKFFRNTPAFRAAISTPFLSSWAFDVEFLGRLLVGTPDVDPVLADQIIEVPLERWRDVSGSKVSWASMVRAGVDLVLIEWDLSRRRRSRNKARVKR